MILAIFCLLLTIATYWAAKWVYQRKPLMFLSPLLVTPILLVAILVGTHTPYENYYSGAKWLTDMLQPATIAFAIPLYKNFAVLKKHATEVVASVLLGSIMAIVSSALFAEWFHLNTSMVDSLAPRSVTTPIAMEVSQNIGGIPSITAIFVIITGLLGTIIGPVIIRRLRIKNEIARGVVLGTSAHNAGTSKAFEFSSISGTISSVCMILTALITLFIAPFIMPLLTSI
ncbi:CidB/LrgB family autolysis modulator [Brevibacillus ginsengisoli]|uniref:CidB/LrgB family autolysis modulator n=1 Tax=Brevibacillus ginsengisoli TaxID=363854 RepID=UPI003CF2C2C6